MKKSNANASDVQDVSADTLRDPLDTARPIRWGAIVLIAGLGAVIAWAALAPLDQGVPAQGVISIEMRRKTLQHQTGGVVKSVLVKEGDWVKAGQTLMVLDDTFSRANYDAVRTGYLSARAAQSRLLAEQGPAESLAFEADLRALLGEAAFKGVAANQVQLFEARRASLAADLSAMERSLEGLGAQLAGSQQSLANRLAQAQLQEQQVAAVRDLAGEGYASRNQLLQLEQSQTELRVSIGDLRANQERLKAAIAETRQRVLQRRSEYLREVSTQLAEVRKDVDGGAERLRSAAMDLARVEIRSPVDGQVVGLAVTDAGGVISPGQKITDVVPRDEALLVDAKIPPHIIDKVSLGMAAEVRFSTFANTPQLVVQGTIVSLSSDALAETGPMGPMSMGSYYLARIQLTAEGMKKLNGHVMRPGMPAEVLVRLGERTMLQYLLHPLTKRIAASMKEE